MITNYENIQYHEPQLYMEIREFQRRWPVTDPPVPKNMIKWHYHKEVEFILVTEGRMTVHVPEEHWTLGAGDVLIIGSKQLHRTVKLTEFLRILVLQIDMNSHFDSASAFYLKHFRELYRPLSRLNYIYQTNGHTRKEAEAAIAKIYDELIHRHNGYDIAISILLRSLFLELVRNDKLDVLEYDKTDNVNVLEQALLYVDSNLSDKITVAEASQQVNMSYHHFLRTFKKAVGMSFTEYVNFRRIKRAEQLLLTEPWSVEQIGHAIGIPNSPHFYELFKRLNDCTPSEYRKRMNTDAQTHGNPDQVDDR